MPPIPNPITTTKSWRVAELPDGALDTSKHFTLDPAFPLPAELAEGDVLFELLYFSNEPAQRTWLVDVPDEELYMPPVRVNQPMTANAACRVVASNNPDFKPGDWATGWFSWSLHAIYNPKNGGIPIFKIPDGVEPADAIALGLTAQTAYFGIMKWASIDTNKDKLLVVSGAAGAVGSIAVQIAKKVLGIETVWGIAGGPEKCALVESTDIGADKCWDYKQPGWEADFFTEARKRGFVNVYFDNVGGVVTNAVMKSMAMFGKAVMCGSISVYNLEADEPCGIGAEAWLAITTKKLRLQGFIYHEGVAYEEMEKAGGEVFRWAGEGKLKLVKTVWEAGFEDVPKGLDKLWKGDNVGKMITKVKV